MDHGLPAIIEVRDASHVVAARSAARAACEALGFAAEERERIVIAVSELAANLVRHAFGGRARLDRIEQGGRVGLGVETEDRGPGIADPELAVTDGYSSQGGLGCGLGAVNRVMDDLEFRARPGGGTHIVCRRWLRPATVGTCPLHVGIATRAFGDATDNGDDFVVQRWDRQALVGVIDGVGHGVEAHRAARAARCFVEDHFDQPLRALFQGTDRVCRQTRGVVMALARFDLSAGVVEAAGVGNIELRLFRADPHPTFLTRRGIVGVNAPGPAPTSNRWTPQAILVLHSDGLRSHWGYNDMDPGVWRSPPEAARVLLQAQSRGDDDATVVVVGNEWNEP